MEVVDPRIDFVMEVVGASMYFVSEMVKGKWEHHRKSDVCRCEAVYMRRPILSYEHRTFHA
jgi:hypothetical protein